MAADVLGTPVKRVEDPRFITGKGRYLDDISAAGDGPPGHPAQPVRARQHPLDRHDRARRRCPASSPSSPATRFPYNPLPMAWPAGGSAGIQNNVNTPRVLATDSVKWTGEGVAAVVAETAGAGGRRAGRTSTSTTSRCRRSSTPRRPSSPAHRSSTRTRPTTSSSSGPSATRTAPQRPSTAAEVVVSQRLVNQRLIPNPMEVRGDIGWYNPGTDEYTRLDVEPDAAHPATAAGGLRDGHPRAQAALHQPGRRRRLRHARSSATPTWRWCMFATKPIGGRPVKWVEARRENYQSTIHGRDHITYLEIAGKRDGDGHRPARQDAGQPRRPPLDHRPRHPDDALRARAVGLLQDPQRLRRGHRASTPTRRSWTPTAAPAGPRRPTSSSAPWTCSRPRSAWTAPRSGARNFIAAGPVPLREPVRARHRVGRRQDLHRLGQLRAGPGEGARGGRLRGPRRGQGARPKAAASCSGSASPRTSRSAASRRPSGSAPSARAGARRCGSRPTSAST